MTNAGLHAAVGVPAPRQTDPTPKRRVPQGMWWVAWRQHRVQIAVMLAVCAASIAAMVIFRQVVLGGFADAGCGPLRMDCQTADGYDVWYSGPNRWAGFLMIGMFGAPIALGAFAGAALFTREFAHGTQIFALTQSVSRRRWWTAKTVVLGVAVVAPLLVMGYVAQWVQQTFGQTRHSALSVVHFLVRGPIPALIGLAVFAVAVAIGILVRNVLGSLATALAIGIVIVIGLALAQPFLVPATRATHPLDQALSGAVSYTPQDADMLVVRGGYLDIHGHRVSRGVTQGCQNQASDAATKVWDSRSATMTEAETNTAAQGASTTALAACYQDRGVAASYTDYLPGSMLWPLRGVFTGICVVLAALALAVGAWRLPRAVAKR